MWQTMKINIKMKMKMLSEFISWIPAYYRLFKKWYLYPDHIDFALTNYEEALLKLTGGKLSKVLYTATYIVDTVQDHFCEDCDLKGEDE
jgi:hypothetical protein